MVRQVICHLGMRSAARRWCIDSEPLTTNRSVGICQPLGWYPARKGAYMSAVALATRPLPLAALRLWATHLLSFVFPLLTLGFVASGPHSGYGALLWLLPLPVLDWWDHRSGAARHQPMIDAPAWLFDAMLYALAALQFL